MGIAPFARPAATSAPKLPGKIRQAMAFLREQMDGQEHPAADLEAHALEQGIAHSTLAVARQRLHIRSEKRGSVWYWLPPDQTRRKKHPVIV